MIQILVVKEIIHIQREMALYFLLPNMQCTKLKATDVYATNPPGSRQLSVLFVKVYQRPITWPPLSFKVEILFHAFMVAQLSFYLSISLRKMSSSSSGVIKHLMVFNP